MAPRSTQPVLPPSHALAPAGAPGDPLRDRQLAAEQLRTLAKRYDLAEFAAQLHAPDLVDMLAGFAQDMTITLADLPVLSFRADMALKVIERASGRPGTKAEVTVHSTGDANDPAVAEIQLARATAAAIKQVGPYLGRHPSEWPPELRAQMGLSNEPITVDAEQS